MSKKCTLIYKPIPDFPDYYAASNGKIYSVKKKKSDKEDSKPRLRELTAYIQPGSKYLSVNIIRNKRRFHSMSIKLSAGHSQEIIRLIIAFIIRGKIISITNLKIWIILNSRLQMKMKTG